MKLITYYICCWG